MTNPQPENSSENQTPASTPLKEPKEVNQKGGPLSPEAPPMGFLPELKGSLSERLQSAFPTYCKAIRAFCLSYPVQSLLSSLFPYKGFPQSPLGLTLSSRGYDPSTKEYFQETWLDRQLYPCHQADILWQASSQPKKTTENR